ncbi:spore coat protein [Neobacillus drentensis]|uniref:spore coat protein n=1 Tax=Neobacillus drentensis TaxID=220684 RepID=UPI002FFEFB16
MHNDIMKYFIGKVIKVNRGGSESRIGKLMHASEDHLALFTEDDGLVYYNTQHIKSFTDNMKGQMEFNIVVPNDIQYKKADNFYSLLESLKFQWVKINRGGPEKLEGVLSDIHHDYVSLINKEEIVRLSMFHIKNISYGLKVENAQDQKSNNQASNQSKQSNKQEVYRSSKSEKQNLSQYEAEKQSYKSDSDRKKSRQRVQYQEEPLTFEEPYAEEVMMERADDDDVSLSELLSSMEKYLRKVAKKE